MYRTSGPTSIRRRMPDIFQTLLVSIIGGLATGITGLFGLALTQRYTDNRKLIDSTLKELEELTNECAKASCQVWSKAGDPLAPEVSETICLLHDISGLISFVKQRVSTAGLRVDSAHLNFRRAASGGDFDVKSRPADVARVGEVRSAAASLKMAARTIIYERNRIGLY